MKIILHTSSGPIHLELEAKKTPQTVENFIRYAKEGFYDGTIFHRVIDGFMVQGGGFLPGMIQKNPTYPPIENEAMSGISNSTGTISMARTMEPHSASSQFFINLQNNPFLDHQSPSSQGWGYCAFGNVVQGLEVVKQIGKVPTDEQAGHQDVPVKDVILERVEIIEE